jgi:hypothetical protein
VIFDNEDGGWHKRLNPFSVLVHQGFDYGEYSQQGEGLLNIPMEILKLK